MKRNSNPPGKLVDINGHKMHVFVQGQGAYTVVFLAGSGTPCPTYDFKPLWEPLRRNHRIAVVERAGYGWSEPSEAARDIDTVLFETRSALLAAGAEPPYVVVPHSMAGLEAIYWNWKHPEEVRAIVALDAAVPLAYEAVKLPSSYVRRLLRGTCAIGLHRPFVKAVLKNHEAVKNGVLSKEEAEAMYGAAKESLFSADVIREMDYVMKNADRVAACGCPMDIPILCFLSDPDKMNIQGWGQMHKDYFAPNLRAVCYDLNCGHYVHLERPEIILDKMELMIQNL